MTSTTSSNTATTPVESSRVTTQHRSGDPDLAFQTDDQIYPPKFGDKYEERAYLKHRLTLAFRIFANYGFSEGLAGHITVRDPVDPESFWVNPFGLHFSLIRDEDLIRVDHTGKVVDGGRNRRLNYGTTYGRAFCATDHVLYTNFAGLVFATEEGKAIAACLGDRKAALLGNHGLLTAGPSIEAAVAWFVLLEKLCEIQLAADASAAGSGKPLVKIGHEEALSTHHAIGRPEGGYFTGLTLFQVVEKEFGEMTFLGRGVESL
ncbi:hypothetical protein CORC01_08262 [Colletotrichum orchidophilum]|uniref:Class II aldolase/adducin N-terminal domain-containing protein n=1 Tax=Colletotrichum orchidophilum TaxID=1209926 RepID=A0A1G4B4Z1_9PEZI|nr:uncharacterized protein CORC01_08262 [Colletotrichum orchidophilum]OHE96499.1 hypothetical protein CORC01_08262 [Colletotrichum orchidophilum]